MKNKFLYLTTIAAIAVAGCTASAFAEEKTSELHSVTLTFDPAAVQDVEVKGVGVKGEFLFYDSNMTGHTQETGMADGLGEPVGPSGYEEGMAPIGGLYYEDMVLNDDGLYEITFDLPAGVYPYNFVINPELGETNPDFSWSDVITKDGEKKGFKDILASLMAGEHAETNRWIPDPNNMPQAPTATGTQSGSELIVGTPEESARVPIGDPAKTGTLSYQSYIDVDGNTQSVGVYLPAGYDKSKTYPLVIVSHGGGGNECDWFSQGQLNNILDNMIAEGRTKEAIFVTPNNAVYDWDYEKIDKNIQEYLIPYLQTIYNISDDVHDRAFCGLSMGSQTTLHMFYHHSDEYDYFGAFSGGCAPGSESYSVEDPHIKEVSLLIGCAEEDIAYNQNDNGVPTTIAALEEEGVPFEAYFVTGSHDWFCWPEMFEYFAENTLWK